MHDSTSELARGKGPSDVVRKIRLAPCIDQKLHVAVSRLKGTDGVIDAEVNQSRILYISYDASAIGFIEIESILGEVGIARKTGFWTEFKSMLYGYKDRNAKSAAHSGGGACCNRPPSPLGKKR